MGRKRLYLSATERQRAKRARDRAGAAYRLDAPGSAVVAVADHADPVGALAEWARQKLIVPPGHPRSGEPLELMPFAVDWLRSTWDTHESALSTARKNAKSAIAAVLALGYLVGPLRRPGWRGAIASISKEKAAELRRQVREIAEASNLDVRIRRSPYPGVIESSTGSLDTLSADRTAGHSSGYDLVIVDETGLLPERARDLSSGAEVVACRHATGRSATYRSEETPDSFARCSITLPLCLTSTRPLTTATLTTKPHGGRRIPRLGIIKSDCLHARRSRTDQGCRVRRTKFQGVGSESRNQSGTGNGLQSRRSPILLR